MYRRVDPSSSLRQEDLGRVGRNSLGVRVSYEFSLVGWEMLEDQGGQVSIFTQVQQVLQVEGIDAVLRVLVDDLVGDE